MNHQSINRVTTNIRQRKAQKVKNEDMEK